MFNQKKMCYDGKKKLYSMNPTLYNKIKVPIIKKIYLLLTILSGITVLSSAALVYSVLTHTNPEHTSMPGYIWSDLAGFIVIISGLFFLKRKPQISAYILIFFFLVTLADPDLIITGMGIPLIYSALVISPTSSFVVAILFAIESTLVLRFDAHIPFTLTTFYEQYFVAYMVALCYSIVSYFLSKSFYKGYQLYEIENQKLTEAQQKLSEKVTNQEQIIKNQEQKESELNNKLEDMRFSLERLKQSRHNP